jgi:ribose transport system ATP-binding protein
VQKNILELKNITKRFAGITALKDVSLTVRENEILALAGENGAGKSTLIKVITGAHLPSEGEMWFAGKKVEQFSPSVSSSLGISVIYQEHNLMPHLTVCENIFFGRELKNGILLDKKTMTARCTELIEEIGVDLRPNEKVRDLSIAGQQLVEILKAVSQDTKFLVMDEPSAPLTEQEIKKMFAIVNKLKQKGVSILYISHRLEEIFQIADRVSILRDGEMVTTLDIAAATVPELVRHMVGWEVGQNYPSRITPLGGPVLSVEGYENKKVRGCSLTLHKGEILGLGGLVGAGRTELVRSLFGADPISAGKLWLNGKEVKIRTPLDAIENGIGFITEDRKAQGLLLSKSIDFNIVFACMNRVSTGGIVRRKKEAEISAEYAGAMTVKAYSPNQPARTLSGGNQQKVVLAKWLATLPDILILDEPTRGIDVGAKSEIYQLMRNLAESGKSIIMISSEMPELIGMCDRILVMRNGRIAGELRRGEFSQERILELAALETTQSTVGIA